MTRWRSKKTQFAIKKSALQAIKATQERYIRSNRAPVVYLLAIMAMFWNVLEADSARFAFAQTAQGGYLNIDPSTVNKILRSIDKYTPIIQEESIDLELVYDTSLNAGFLNAQKSEGHLITVESDLETEYVVKKGDTLSGIAQRHNTTVATLIDRNKLDLKKIESLSLGETIVIPPKITSDSTKWLEDLQEAQRQRRIAATRSVPRNTTQNATSGYGSIASRNLMVPIRYRYISRGMLRYHHGIDYVAPTGTAVVAAGNGKVVQITHGWAGGFGISILIDHGGGLTTRYAHLSRVEVSIGQNVSKGQHIALSGNTGNSTGPHLHFETRLNNRPVYPY